MRARLRYLTVLLISAAAAALGAWPSILTIGAVVAIGTGLAAIVGVAKPSIIDRRVLLRRLTLGGGGVLALELIALIGWFAITPHRTVHLVVPSAAPTIVRVVYDVRDGAASPVWRWDRYFRADTGAHAVIYTRLPLDAGWWFPKGSPHPVVARTRAGATIAARWISGGFTQAGSCQFAFDEFSVGGTPLEPRNRTTLLTAGWLDSLSTWGVECRGGHLSIGAGGAAPRRTTEACYSNADGGVACKDSARPAMEQPQS
jgi:hypothetical protein